MLSSLRADIAEAVLPLSPDRAGIDFDAYRRLRTVALLRVELWFGIIANLLWFSTDFYVFRDDPHLMRSVLGFRAGYVTVSACLYLLARRRHAGVPGVMVTYLLLAGGSFAALGWIDAVHHGSLFSATFAVPFLTIIYLLPLRTRIALNVAVCVVMSVAYFAANPEALSRSAYLCTFLPFAGFCSVLLGHFLYELNHTTFKQRREIQRYAEELERANRMKDAFVATVSHELRTPLNSILGMTEALEEEPLEPQARRYLGAVRHSGEVLLSLINDLLTLARLKADRITLEAVPYSLAEVVARSVEMVSVNTRAKGLELSGDVPADLPSLLGDPLRLEQVLLNLLSNAVKFTERGAVRVRVQRSQDRLQISVSDTGMGVPPEKRQLVFEEFTQADATTTRKFGGTGLGLAIVRRLVTMMGGTVALTPNEPRGSVFTVDLPVVLASAPVPEAEVAVAPPAGRADRPRVLVVDDSPDNRAVIQALLLRDDVDLTFAENGREGVERFQTQAFDVVLMDIEMPELDGYGAVRLIREWEKQNARRPVTIAALTAHGTAEHQRRTRESGFSAYLLKPLKRRDLQRLLGTTARLASVAETNASTPEVKTLLPGYLARRREQLLDLCRWAEQRDFESLRRAGHEIKGSGAMYGLAQISRIGAALEEAAASRQPGSIAGLLREMEAALTGESSGSASAVAG